MSQEEVFYRLGIENLLHKVAEVFFIIILDLSKFTQGFHLTIFAYG